MKFGFRSPSFKKRVSARLSLKRVLSHSIGLKAPKGFGFITNPKKALYNRIYNRTTFGLEDVFENKTSKKGTRINVRKKAGLFGSIILPNEQSQFETPRQPKHILLTILVICIFVLLVILLPYLLGTWLFNL